MCLLRDKLFNGNQKPIFYLISFLILMPAYIIAGQPSVTTCSDEPEDIHILQKWSGDYPIVHLNRLSEDQQMSGIGHIGPPSRLTNCSTRPKSTWRCSTIKGAGMIKRKCCCVKSRQRIHKCTKSLIPWDFCW